ncbi:MAG: 3,4-dioxygenase subunit beta [Thermoleophilia bacterium]|nr:3,4-dioxygenase subunit beta [Thermoleophilia bacterium]
MSDHVHGLRQDMGTLMTRRRALAAFGAGALGVVAGCGGSGTASRAPSTTATSSAAGVPRDPIPEETAGPYPGDGSNGPNALDDAGIVRRDIRSSVGIGSATAEGVPLALAMAIVTAAGEPVAGAAVYAWHCDRDGNYSLYASGLENENYLRGVQAAGADGKVTFRSVFPGCYAGRWPHVHFEVYASLAHALEAGPIVATSQIALPKAECDATYATDGYATSAGNLAGISLAADNVFGDDGAVHQLATMTGDAASGFTAALTVPVAH